MSEHVDDLTIQYEEEGVITCKELDKAILSKGAWATVMYLYQDWNKSKEEYGPEKATIRRYRKLNGSYRQQSKFNISSGKQARSIIAALSEWFEEEE